jgi:hypothetical protein
VLAGALALCVVCALCIPFVKINYEFSDYLPETSASTKSLQVLEDSFGGNLPNGYIYAQGVSLMQAEALAGNFEDIDGISDVLWLGSVVDIRQPLEIYDESTVSAWKSEEGYLYQITLDSTKAVAAVAEAKEVAAAGGASNVALSGDAVNTAVAQGSSDFEVQVILVMAVLVILGLLLLTSEAWFEPVLFLSVIGLSIIYNLGTNIVFGEISFITQMCAAVLQLAVSMDYGIVMLHEYRHFKSEGLVSYEAAVSAMHKASGVIASSAATTFFGFLSLCVMAFLIGADMGVVLAKGIVFSFLSVLFILPVLVLLSEKLLQKTAHRKLLPSFTKFARFCVRVSVPFTVVAALVVVPCFLGSRQTEFVYGASGFVEPGSEIYEDTNLIEDTFNASGQWVLLVPEGNWGTEKELTQAIKDMPHVTSVTSYITSVSERIPTEMVPEESLSALISGGYSRIIIGTDYSGESEGAFSLIQTIRDTAQQYYPETYELVGGAVTCYDMSLIVNDDSLRVLLASILAIGLVLLVMFRSISIPIILLFTIELSIWINLAIPYFMGTSIQYIGYLIISAIMLGATVDYTIILSRSYLEMRQTMPKRQAIVQAISYSAITILTSATILTLCGIFISVISSNGVISGLGTLIGRGAFIAALNTFFLLPTLFMIFDRIIEKTTIGARFYKGKGNTLEGRL